MNKLRVFVNAFKEISQMNVSSLVGQVLLWAGFLSGALASVFEVKNKSDEWATINWSWFIASIIIGAIGIAVYRASRRSTAAKEEKLQSDFDCLRPALEQITVGIASLRKNLDELAPTQITKTIDDELVDEFRKFADARESIIEKQGMAEYANITTQFAAGERAVNRAWSAGADGYVDEVASCLDRASVLIDNALKMLK